MSGKLRVLILCTGNSARSQMAEGWLNALGGDRFQAFSAGSDPAGTVHPLAIRAMAEVGIDIRHHRSKSMFEFIDQPFDYVITVCAPAAEACPVFPGPARRLHWPLDDPVEDPPLKGISDLQGAEATGGEEERLAVFRRVRDEIRARLESFVASPDLAHSAQQESFSGSL
jgi:arsenate reductase